MDLDVSARRGGAFCRKNLYCHGINKEYAGHVHHRQEATVGQNPVAIWQHLTNTLVDLVGSGRVGHL